MGMQPPNVVTIEKTAKRFKAIMLVGVIGLFLSPAPAVYGFVWIPGEPKVMRMIGASAICGAVSFLIYLIGRGLAWWYHG